MKRQCDNTNLKRTQKREVTETDRYCNGTIELRPVSAEDQEFLTDLFIEVRSNQYALSGWDEEQIRALLRTQFEFQQQSYRMQFPGAIHSIVQSHGVRIGRIIINRTDNELRLVDISLLPEFRNAGTGTALISSLIDEAREQNAKILLTVASDNTRAFRLYKRLGFRETGTDEFYISMEWQREETLDKNEHFLKTTPFE